MMCEHLLPLERALQDCGIRETYRGKPWSLKCREWVYFDCFIDTDSVRSLHVLPGCVVVHSHCGTHDGQERGFVCTECHDGIMGSYEHKFGTTEFRG